MVTPGTRESILSALRDHWESRPWLALQSVTFATEFGISHVFEPTLALPSSGDLTVRVRCKTCRVSEARQVDSETAAAAVVLAAVVAHPSCTTETDDRWTFPHDAMVAVFGRGHSWRAVVVATAATGTWRWMTERSRSARELNLATLAKGKLPGWRADP